jgi:hypothetical protein
MSLKVGRVSPLRAGGNGQEAWVGNRGAQGTDMPYLCEFKGARRDRRSGESLSMTRVSERGALSPR